MRMTYMVRIPWKEKEKRVGSSEDLKHAFKRRLVDDLV